MSKHLTKEELNEVNLCSSEFIKGALAHKFIRLRVDLTVTKIEEEILRFRENELTMNTDAPNFIPDVPQAQAPRSYINDRDRRKKKN